ncbi:MAG: rRNA maturation RNase YbeY [Pseudomonadota bacterium]
MRVTVTLSSSASLSPFYARRIRTAVKRTLLRIPKRVMKSATKKRNRIIISVALVGIKAIRDLNRTFRKKDKPTDVLSFSRLESPFPEVSHNEIGDLIICLPVAKKQAKEFKETLGRELERLTVHGTLHLFGFDHERSKKDARIMFQLQDKILQELSPRHLKT